MSEFVRKIIHYIMEDNNFNDFKLRKSDGSFSLKKNGITKRVLIEEWVNDERTELIIKPFFIIRIDKLHKWYEPYHSKSISDQKIANTTIFTADQFGFTEKYQLDLNDFNETIEIAKKEIVELLI